MASGVNNFACNVNGAQSIESLPSGNKVNCSNSDNFTEEFEFNQSTCYICNGYYGPCFGEPVCATCHAFLFPEELSCRDPMPVFSEKTDDGDSGNDEPTDLFYGPTERRSSSQGGSGGAQGVSSGSAQGGSESTPACASPPMPVAPRPDSLAQRVELLTTPREADDVTPELIAFLPPEVLLAVFSYLDDMSLWCVGNVCKHWRRLLQTHVPADLWRTYTLQRWPLYKPLCEINDWFKVYSQLMESCPCKACLLQMSMKSQPPGEENSWRRNRLSNELKGLKTDPPEGIEAIPLDQKNCHWMATITGPVGSPYEGGVFYLYLQVPYSYPMCPPVVRFLTKVFHPNVSRHGDVGIDSIHHNWSLALTISKVLISVQSLLTDPYCQVCMEPDVGRLYQNERDTFDAIARSWTWRFAMHDVVAPA